MIRFGKLGYVALNVSDIERSTVFYRDVLGLGATGEGPAGARYFRCGPSHHATALHPGVPVVHGPGRHPPSGSVFLYFLDPDGLTLEYSFGMEEFPERGARRPRVLEPVQESFDYWGAPRVARKSQTGAIEQA